VEDEDVEELVDEEDAGPEVAEVETEVGQINYDEF
jgi:hypothetical protein